jgi:hypothetical protein
MVCLVTSLLAISQLLRAVGSLVSVGEVGDELILKFDPAIDVSLLIFLVGAHTYIWDTHLHLYTKREL